MLVSPTVGFAFLAAAVYAQDPRSLSAPEPFEIPILQGMTDIVAQIGPSGGDRGYSAITNMTSFLGVAWYMNDLLIPVIEMRRGTTYTFRVSGGNNSALSGEYHPFYLTSSETGGYAQLDPAVRAQETVFAGINVTETDSSGGVVSFVATIKAPICMYKTTATTQNVSISGDFQEYFDSLDTSCQNDSSIIDAAAVFEFTPNKTTPDLIYYQCVIHSNLGWKIMVLDANETALTPMPYTEPSSQAPASSPAAPTAPQAPASAPVGGAPTAGGGSTSSALATGLATASIPGILVWALGLGW